VLSPVHRRSQASNCCRHVWRSSSTCDDGTSNSTSDVRRTELSQISREPLGGRERLLAVTTILGLGMPIMALYADSDFPVGSELEAVHASQLNQLENPGSWGTGAQRLAVVIEARRACFEAGVLEAPQGFKASSRPELPQGARKFIRQLAVSPKDVTKDTYDDARANGLSDPGTWKSSAWSDELAAWMSSLGELACRCGPCRRLRTANHRRSSLSQLHRMVRGCSWYPICRRAGRLRERCTARILDRTLFAR